jgi:hypothetical protein
MSENPNPTAPTTGDPDPDAPQPEDDALQPEDVRTQPPARNEGSGQFAVWDHDLGQYVSGVSDKATADKARKSLEEHNGAITDGHKLETREV